MLDLIGEILQSAERDAFFRRVNDISIADGGIWKDYL
jgi:hypothetical protein